METNSFKIVTGKEITDNDILEFIEIDKEVYPEKYRGTFEVCKNWHNRNPDIFIVLKDIKIARVVGCINLMPLNDSYYKVIEDGDFIDLDIPAKEIRLYNEPGLYKMCLISIILLKSYQDSQAIKVLYSALLGKLTWLSEQGIYCDEMIADAISPDGEKFCKSLGMSEIGRSSHNSMIMKVKFFPFEFNVIDEKGRKLRDGYDDSKS